MQFKKHLAESLLAFTLACGSAHAAPLQFEYSAIVTYTDNSLQGVNVGTTFTGTFSYDPETPASYIYTSTAHYSFGASSQLTADILGHQITASHFQVDVINNMGGNVEDGVTISGGYPLVVDGITFASGSMGFNLTTRPGNTGVLTSTDLPSSYDVSAFDGHPSLTYGWMQRDGGQTGTLLQFSVSSISVAAPEPATNVLLALGLISVPVVARRRKKA